MLCPINLILLEKQKSDVLRVYRDTKRDTTIFLKIPSKRITHVFAYKKESTNNKSIAAFFIFVLWSADKACDGLSDNFRPPILRLGHLLCAILRTPLVELKNGEVSKI